jgi:alkanesulfonate monooxygenase SsuD/methylene tetrahydromethanopterin reductase-like flavin-dependent oxidoreductase (luciferase family)
MPDDEYTLLNNALYQIELADRLGYDHVWAVEHHFLEEHSHSSAPEVFLGAASQRTSRIRLGHGIVQLPTNHPARVVERVSTLDLVSNGRVELGVGEGLSDTELLPFGRSRAEATAVFEDTMRAMMPMFWSEGWEYQGEHVQFPMRNVVPKPRQKPHPPLWLACTELDSIVTAGKRGIGALGFKFVSSESARVWVSAYYNAITKRLRKLTDYRINPNIALVCHFMCASTDEEARRRADGSTFFAFAKQYYAERGAIVPGTVNLWREYQAWRETPAGELMQQGGLIGSPATISEKLHRFAEAGVDQVILVAQGGRSRHEHICESLEIFASEVMDEFHAMEPQHAEWKRLVMAGEVQLPEVDVAPYLVPAYSPCL